MEIVYSGVGTGLVTAGYIPLAIGTGLVTAGSYLIDCGMWMQNKGAECKLYAAGLKALKEGELDKAKVNKLAKKNNWSFKEALIHSYIQKMKEAQSKDKSQDEQDESSQDDQNDQDEPQDNQDESQDNDVAAAMKAAMVLV